MCSGISMQTRGETMEALMNKAILIFLKKNYNSLSIFVKDWVHVNCEPKAGILEVPIENKNIILLIQSIYIIDDI